LCAGPWVASSGYGRSSPSGALPKCRGLDPQPTIPVMAAHVAKATTKAHREGRRGHGDPRSGPARARCCCDLCATRLGFWDEMPARGRSPLGSWENMELFYHVSRDIELPRATHRVRRALHSRRCEACDAELEGGEPSEGGTYGLTFCADCRARLDRSGRTHPVRRVPRPTGRALGPSSGHPGRCSRRGSRPRAGRGVAACLSRGTFRCTRPRWPLAASRWALSRV
jgi:hypothetical protein